jgi:hypothetical protein
MHKVEALNKPINKNRKFQSNVPFMFDNYKLLKRRDLQKTKLSSIIL